MTRLMKLSLCSLFLALSLTAATPAESRADSRSSGYSGHVEDIYVYDLYYHANGQWQLYGRYFASRCRTTGYVDYGGLFQAQNYIASQGYQWWRSAPRYWRTTNNG